MIKKRQIPRGIAMVFVIASLLSILTYTTTAAPITETKTIPTGETSFSVDLQVDESTPYAGIEFTLTISDKSALAFSSFTSIPNGASAAPFIEKDGLYYFGFFTASGSNLFNSGDMLAGRLNFTGYTGDQALTITIVDMTVTRINANKQSVSVEKDSPAYVYLIQREDIQTNFHAVIFDAAGGIRIGGGALSQTIAEGGAANAPTLIRNGYDFVGWDKTFNNVTADIAVTAKWTASSGGNNTATTDTTYYTVTFIPAGGTRIGGGALEQTITSGSAAIAPILTREGYTFDGWDKSFSNITGNITVTALWLEVKELPDDETPLSDHIHYFDDVTDTLYPWAEVEVCALAKAGVVNGTADRIYSPAANIKRGDFTLMLARAYDINDAFTENFPDVPVGSYYYDAIGSAKIKGIAKGYSDVEFCPEKPMLRQEMMVLIDRTLDKIGKTLPRGNVADIDIFTDRNLIADYALDSVAALVKSGIIQGDGTKVNPLGYTTRAEMACALYRLMILTGDLVVD